MPKISRKKAKKLLDIISTPTEKLLDAIEREEISEEEAKKAYEAISTPEERLLDIIENIDKFKGKDGKTPTTEELQELVKPLIPKPIKGEDGKTPTTDELVEIIKPLIPAPIPGKNGNEFEAKDITEKYNAIPDGTGFSVLKLRDLEWLGKGMNWNNAGFKLYTDNTLTGDGTFAHPLHSVAADIAALWGNISGTITNQTDLISYLGTNYLKLDQTTPQTIINGRPIFNLGLTFTETTDPVASDSTHAYFWLSDTNGKSNFNIIGSDGIKQRVMRDLISTVRNITGVTIPRGKAVFSRTSTGTAPNIELAKADSMTTMVAIGITMEDIADNAYGRIQRFGRTEFQFDTTAWNEGDELFVSPTTAGELTNVRPTYPYFPQAVGQVVVKGVGNGSIFTDFTSYYNGHSSGTVENTWTFGATPATSLILAKSSTAQRTATFPDMSGTVGLTTGALTPGSVLFADANGFIGQDNTNLFWDDTNDAFRIQQNNTTPTASNYAFLAQNLNSAGQTTFYFSNDRTLANLTSYGGLIYGGSATASAGILGAGDRKDKMFLFTAGASNLGMWLGTTTAQPLAFSTNNLERGRFDLNGWFSIGAVTAQARFNLYSTGSTVGTVSTTAGNKTLTGVGTKFTQHKIWDYIEIAGETSGRYITSIASDTSLQVSANWANNNSNVAYTTKGDVGLANRNSIRVMDERVVIGHPEYGNNIDYSAALHVTAIRSKIRLDSYNANNYVDLMADSSSGAFSVTTGYSMIQFFPNASSANGFYITAPGTNQVTFSGGRNSSTGIGVSLILRGGETNDFQAGNLYMRGGNYTGTGTFGQMIWQNPRGTEDWFKFDTTGLAYFPQDASATKGKVFFGAGNDAYIGYDGTNFVINPKVVGTGYVDVQGGIVATDITDSALTASLAVYTDANKKLTSTAPTTGIIGYLTRTGTTLYPTNTNDSLDIGSGEYFTTTGFHLKSNSSKIYFGASDNTSIGFDGTRLVIKPSGNNIIRFGDSTASSITLQFGTITETASLIYYNSDITGTTGQLYSNRRFMVGAGTDDGYFQLIVAGTSSFEGNLSLLDYNVILGTTTGTKIGTATNQKLGFFNATPVVQPANTVAINDTLVNLGLRASGGSSNFSTDIKLVSDSLKSWWGAGNDMTIWYDGTNGNIKTSDVAASDLHVQCGTDKTVVLDETVYDDMQFAVASGKVPAANFPNWETFTTNTEAYAFSVGDMIQLGANEPPHGWKEGTTGSAHIHFAIKSANTSGGNQYVKIELIFAYADYNGVWTEQAALTSEATIANGAGALQNYLLTDGTVTLTGLHLGSQVRCRVKRIAATGGTEYADDVYITQVGVHLEIDTLGSRTVSTK